MEMSTSGDVAVAEAKAHSTYDAISRKRPFPVTRKVKSKFSLPINLILLLFIYIKSITFPKI